MLNAAIKETTAQNQTSLPHQISFEILGMQPQQLSQSYFRLTTEYLDSIEARDIHTNLSGTDLPFATIAVFGLINEDCIEHDLSAVHGFMSKVGKSRYIPRQPPAMPLTSMDCPGKW